MKNYTHVKIRLLKNYRIREAYAKLVPEFTAATLLVKKRIHNKLSK